MLGKKAKKLPSTGGFMVLRMAELKKSIMPLTRNKYLKKSMTKLFQDYFPRFPAKLNTSYIKIFFKKKHLILTAA